MDRNVSPVDIDLVKTTIATQSGGATADRARAPPPCAPSLRPLPARGAEPGCCGAAIDAIIVATDALFKATQTGTKSKKGKKRSALRRPPARPCPPCPSLTRGCCAARAG